MALHRRARGSRVPGRQLDSFSRLVGAEVTRLLLRFSLGWLLALALPSTAEAQVGVPDHAVTEEDITAVVQAIRDEIHASADAKYYIDVWRRGDSIPLYVEPQWHDGRFYAVY